jgi:flagellin
LSITVKVNAVDGAGNVTDLQYSTDAGKTWKAASNTGVSGAEWTLEQGIKVKSIAVTGQNVGTTGTIAATAEKLTFELDGDGAGANAIGKQVDVYNNQSSVTVGSDASDQTLTANFTFANVKTGIASQTSYTTTHSTTFTQTITSSTKAVIGNNGTVTKNADTKCGINVKSQSKANNAISTIDNAIKKVSDQRSKLGAYQNRLEHTIANLGTSSENLTSAESRIRDVDMAKEMSTYSKNNILAQAAQSMLAQANQQPQQVLQLLR